MNHLRPCPKRRYRRQKAKGKNNFDKRRPARTCKAVRSAVREAARAAKPARASHSVASAATAAAVLRRTSSACASAACASVQRSGESKRLSRSPQFQSRQRQRMPQEDIYAWIHNPGSFHCAYNPAFLAL